MMIPQSIHLYNYDLPPLNFKSKVVRSPSLRAMNNYHNLSIETYDDTLDNLNFLPETETSKYDEPFTISHRSVLSDTSTLDNYGYTAVRSFTPQTVSTISEVGSTKDMGSTVKLVPPKLETSGGHMDIKNGWVKMDGITGSSTVRFSVVTSSRGRKLYNDRNYSCYE
ncbi:hypothetical protein WA026_014677 [Henosepilachna vigintioctopunctata]|uniref:Uncharacterized protein n=1 Tax=Henosepilachna vigintioctopunctata TaxID=420089 RepID=A0AAW1VDV4_9CUCU